MSDDEPNYTFYGNALEPLNEDDIARKKPIPLEEQVARDKQGRRRFHGAFTGGFSAGFFNSVGSLEGWKPSTFQSSRAEKAEKRQQRPEDFMDDEDQEVFGIAPKVLRARSDYTDTRSRPTATSSDLGVIPEVQSTLGEILKPVRESVGARLLKKMGWKQGQGVGPRVSKKEKKQQRQQNEVPQNNGYQAVPETYTKYPETYSPENANPEINYEPYPKIRKLHENSEIGPKYPETGPKYPETGPKYPEIGPKYPETIKISTEIPEKLPIIPIQPLGIQISNFQLDEKVGDVFSSPSHVSLAHCVGKDLKMKKGIALEFKRRFGDLKYLRGQNKQLGEVAVLPYYTRYIFYLITKESTFDHTCKLETLAQCLINMKALCVQYKITELALPKIATGLDKLDWTTVKNLIIHVFNESHIKITIYRLPDLLDFPKLMNNNLPNSNIELPITYQSPSYQTPKRTEISNKLGSPNEIPHDHQSPIYQFGKQRLPNESPNHRNLKVPFYQGNEKLPISPSYQFNTHLSSSQMCGVNYQLPKSPDNTISYSNLSSPINQLPNPELPTPWYCLPPPPPPNLPNQPQSPNNDEIHQKSETQNHVTPKYIPKKLPMVRDTKVQFKIISPNITETKNQPENGENLDKSKPKFEIIHGIKKTESSHKNMLNEDSNLPTYECEEKLETSKDREEIVNHGNVQRKRKLFESLPSSKSPISELITNKEKINLPTPKTKNKKPISAMKALELKVENSKKSQSNFHATASNTIRLKPSPPSQN